MKLTVEHCAMHPILQASSLITKASENISPNKPLRRNRLPNLIENKKC
jgi:hypothetical protein